MRDVTMRTVLFLIGISVLVAVTHPHSPRKPPWWLRDGTDKHEGTDKRGLVRDRPR